MTYRKHFALFSATILFYAAYFIPAAPVIEFDTKEFQCGVVDEGTKTRIDAVFTVKNSGDSTLIITGVRPGCGCTVVTYDSIIEPGKAAPLKASMKIAGFRSGLLSKPVTVFSNAQNDSVAQLVIKATIRAAIDPSMILITMRPNEKTSLQLTTPKKNLKVAGVLFTPHSDDPASTTEPVKVSYVFAPIDSARGDGLTAYRLELEPFAVDSSAEGIITITTNHHHKKEMRIRGRALR
ncbi:MAG: DUF1573 domain-containing protein [Chitinispirillaceae bacterium]|nr:DUF1573 domain-containing protein [Chitinispirillaceae bacterium]